MDIEKMRKLHEEQDFRLLSYNRIQADYEDGCVCTGQVQTTFEVDGNPLHTTAILAFDSDYELKQLCAVTPPGVKRGSIPELSGLNLIACGSDSF
ncbi:hypothetical protein ACFOLF_29515 [Paenibacillus sepulcri]|uniref:Uncharacterized protein n=1 Tax=Paenibacillus sepulcri TaxID=359917 RepID=A0ABS7C0X5_9BACL|nr:hypothetical protein [Paenibacillus sepulcri]